MQMTFGRMSEPLTKVQKVDSTKTAQSYDFMYKYEDSNHPTAPTQIGHEHYTYDADGKMTFEGTKNADPSSRAYYNWYMAPIGNLLIVEAPESLSGPDGIMLTNMAKYNAECVVPAHMGFVFDTTPVTNELAACTNVVAEFKDDLVNGKLSSEDEVRDVVAEFNDKLAANGVDKIVAEVQSQIDAWTAAKAAE